MKPRKIKLFWAIGAIVLLLASAGVALPPLWPRLFHSEVSDLYRRYEHNPHIRATELHDFPVNDTLALDALLLEASSDSAWCALLSDFGAPKDLINLYNTQRHLFVDEGVNSIEIFYIDTNDTRKRLPRAEPGSRLVIGSYKEKSMCVFMTEEKSDKEIICLTKIKDLRK